MQHLSSQRSVDIGLCPNMSMKGNCEIKAREISQSCSYRDQLERTLRLPEHQLGEHIIIIDLERNDAKNISQLISSLKFSNGEKEMFSLLPLL